MPTPFTFAGPAVDTRPAVYRERFGEAAEAAAGIRAREMFGYAIAMLLALIPFLAVALVVVAY